MRSIIATAVMLTASSALTADCDLPCKMDKALEGNGQAALDMAQASLYQSHEIMVNWYRIAVALSGAENSESLDVSGAVDGSPRQGKARYVRCGPDRVPQLLITRGPEQVFYCVPHHDYDNLNRTSCSRRLSDPSGDQELWFQQLAP